MPFPTRASRAAPRSVDPTLLRVAAAPPGTPLGRRGNSGTQQVPGAREGTQAAVTVRYVLLCTHREVMAPAGGLSRAHPNHGWRMCRLAGVPGANAQRRAHGCACSPGRGRPTAAHTKLPTAAARTPHVQLDQGGACASRRAASTAMLTAACAATRSKPCEGAIASTRTGSGSWRRADTCVRKLPPVAPVGRARLRVAHVCSACVPRAVMQVKDSLTALTGVCVCT